MWRVQPEGTPRYMGFDGLRDVLPTAERPSNDWRGEMSKLW